MQIGIVSWGMPCGALNTPVVYTNVQFFGEWIVSTAYSMESTDPNANNTSS